MPDDYYYDYPYPMLPALVVDHNLPRPFVDTGILDTEGNKIIRYTEKKNPFGFVPAQTEHEQETYATCSEDYKTAIPINRHSVRS